MKTNRTAANAIISRSNLLRFSILFAFAALIILSFLNVSSASLSFRSFKEERSDLAATPGVSSARRSHLGQTADKALDKTDVLFRRKATPSLFPLLPQGPALESVATYQSDCVTPLTTFTVGTEVCAKADGPIIGLQTIYWVDSQGGLVQVDTISANSPSARRTVNVSGNWKVYLASGIDGSLRARSAFGVTDPDTPTVDLAVFNDSRSDLSAGGNALYRVIALNQGPSTATNVELSVTVPNNATYVSSSQDSGETFNCTPGTPTICTINSLAPNAFGSFTFIFQINGGTATGTEISSTATINSAIEELHAPDNAAITSAQVVGGGGGASCTLDCPNNVTVTANTTDDGSPQGTPGAIVTFPGADAFGDCGTVSVSPTSGSFFPVGDTTVFATSSLGGGSCSFVVSVVENAAPDISCPANIVTETTGCEPATVNPGVPTATPNGLSISGERNDGQPLDAPYPVGVTTIIWTATDSGGRAATCTQTVTVNSDDTESAHDYGTIRHQHTHARGCPGILWFGDW